MRRRFLLSVVAVALAVPAVPVSASHLPQVSDGPRPGPDVLYRPLAEAPQLENAGPWQADPLMVSGADAYDDGEYLYQDFIYDSYGANTTDIPFDSPEPVPATGDVLFGPMTGDVVYPTDTAAYGNNAADFLELRARLAPEGVAYRITLNTMLAPDAAGIAIAIDTDRDASTGSSDWGHGIGSLGPLGAEHLLVTWGTSATLDGVSVPASADTVRNQIEVQTSLQPGSAAWRHYAVAGLFDTTTGQFKPVSDQPTATHPGGAHGKNPPPVFNVAFRFDEPMGSNDQPAELGSRAVGFGHWRDHAQAKALAARDISSFHADVDFGLLASEVDESRVPRHGYLNRLYVSHQDLGEGARSERPMLLGKIQPYSVYVPSTYRPGHPSPLHVVLHSLSCSYNQYAVFMPRMLTQLGEERGAFVLTTEGRGPDGWYHDDAEYDLFEAWADLADRYDLDSTRVTLSGYSMGGYGTYKMASQYPDLFVSGFAIVGPADENILGGPTAGAIEDDQNTLHIADNLRNVPLLMWNGLNDELVPIAGVVNYEQRLHDLGYRHELHAFPGYDHFLFGVLDEWEPARPWLQGTVDRDPSHVVYRAMPEMDNAALGLVHDHAYWVDDVTVPDGARSGLVDVRSLARGAAEPRLHEVAGVDLAPNPNVKRGISWGAGHSVAAHNALEIGLTDVSSVTLWVERAGIDDSLPLALAVDSNAPSTIVLKGDFGDVAVQVGAGRHEYRVNL